MASIELVDTEKVLNAVKMRGPLIPLDVRKVIGKGDSIVIGAELSSLVQRGLVKVTTIKMGGSPFYYVSGQELKLELILKYLNEKDLRACNLIREKKILRDSKQELLSRVCLRNIKDFAKSFTVKVNNQEEIFWRYFLISEKEAIDLVRKMFTPPVKEIKREPLKNDADEITKPIVQKSEESSTQKPFENEKEVEQEQKKPKPQIQKESQTQKDTQTSLEDTDSKNQELFANTDDKFYYNLKNSLMKKELSYGKVN